MIKCKYFIPPPLHYGEEEDAIVEELNGEQLYDLLLKYYHGQAQIWEVLIDGIKLDLWAVRQSIKW